MPDQDDDDLYFPPTKPKWKRRLAITLIVLLILATAAEIVISSRLGTKLRYTVSNKLDAELRTAAVIYLPPYGVMVFDPKLTRGRDTLFKASSLRLSLANLPKKDQPLIISRLRLSGPELFIAPQAFRDIKKPGGKHLEPKKLSDMLRLSDVRISDGKVQYRDPSRPDALPMTWEGMNVEIDTVQQSTSRYTFSFHSRAGRTADASAAGSIDVDSLLLELRSLTLTAAAEPEPIKSPLPQVVQEWLRKYRVNGNLTVTAAGNIPLREPKQAAFNAKVTLENALGELEKHNLLINKAHAELLCSKSADAPLTVQLKGIEVATAGENGAARSAVVNKGTLTLDPAAGRWSLADVEGFIAMEKTGFGIISAIQPTTSPIQLPKFEEFRPSGRADFSVNASGPFKVAGNPWDAIEHEIIITPRGAAFIPKGFAHTITDIAGGEIRIKGGMIIFEDLIGRYGNDMIRLRSARLPIDGLPRRQRWQEISGGITFARPLRSYTHGFDNIFEILQPEGPFLFAGSYTFDKTDATTRATKSYDLIVSSDTGALHLTPYGIPLTNVRGDATITPNGVQLHGAAADLLTGKITATGQWIKTSDDAWAYDGDTTIRDADVAKLKEVADRPPDTKLRGKLSAQATFSGITLKDQGADDALRRLRASGEMEIVQGEFFHLPVLREILGSIRLKDAATVGDGAAIFDIADNAITFRDAGVNAPVLGLQGGGKLAFDGNVEANVVAAPLADWKEKLKETKIPLVSDVAGEVAGALQKLLNTATGKLLYQFRVTGNVKDKVDVTAVPTPVLTDTAAMVFGRMLRPRSGERPLDWFRRDQPKSRSK